METDFRCPACRHTFSRHIETPRGTTSCPQCRARFSRIENMMRFEESDQRLEEARSEHREVVHRERTGHLDRDGTIRGEQTPFSLAEADFKRRAFAHQWKPHRPSWPDFLVECPDGTVFAVEVKDGRDEVRPEQAETFTVLERIGIPVYVWRRGDPCLRRWSRLTGMPKREKMAGTVSAD